MGLRVLLQFIFGIAGMALLALLLVWLYFALMSEDIRESGYFDYEFPFPVVLITSLNFFYMAYYFYYTPKPVALNNTTPSGNNETYMQEDLLLERVYESGNIVEEPCSEEIQTSLKIKRKVLISDTILRSIPILDADINMVFIYKKTVFIWLKGQERMLMLSGLTK